MTAGLLTGMDGILEGFGNSPNGCVNCNGAGAGATQVEGNMVELIDKILGCEETGGIYEDQSTLTVSFSVRNSERTGDPCYEMRYA
jgi:hypothetical protein